MDPGPGICRGFDCGLPGVEKAEGGNGQDCSTAMLPVILLLQLPASDVIWKYTPHMKFLQFPWRWLMALSVAGCALAAMAVVRQAKWQVIVAGIMIAAMAVGGALLFFQPCDDEDAVTAQLAGFRTGQGTEGRTSTRLSEWIMPPSNNTCPWCVYCAGRRMTQRTTAGKQPGVASRRSRQHSGTGSTPGDGMVSTGQ